MHGNFYGVPNNLYITESEEFLMVTAVEKELKCNECGQQITAKRYFVFVGDNDNYDYCAGCKNDNVEQMQQLDPEVAPLWAKNFKEVINKFAR